MNLLHTYHIQPQQTSYWQCFPAHENWHLFTSQ